MVIHATEYSVFEFCNQRSYIYLYPQNPRLLLQIATTSFAKIFRHTANKSLIKQLLTRLKFFFDSIKESANSLSEILIRINSEFFTISSVSWPIVVSFQDEIQEISRSTSRVCSDNQICINLFQRSEKLSIETKQDDNKTREAIFTGNIELRNKRARRYSMDIRYIPGRSKRSNRSDRSDRWYLLVCRTIGFLLAFPPVFWTRSAN